MTVFNAEEVLELAHQIEVNGGRFYRRAAEVVTAPDVREFLEALAAMEDDHCLIFDHMRADRDTLEALLGDPEGDAVLYLQAFANGQVFPTDADPTTMVTEETTVEQILEMAIEMEKNSIVFYTGIREVVPEDLGRDKIEALIREEMRHVSLLVRRLAAVRAARARG